MPWLRSLYDVAHQLHLVVLYKSQLHNRDMEDQGKNLLALPFCSAEGAQRTLLKYSFAIRILFSKIKVCSGCCKLSQTYEPETLKFPSKEALLFLKLLSFARQA